MGAEQKVLWSSHNNFFFFGGRDHFLTLNDTIPFLCFVIFMFSDGFVFDYPS